MAITSDRQHHDSVIGDSLFLIVPDVMTTDGNVLKNKHGDTSQWLLQRRGLM